jgi:hypothetical protein
LSEEMHGGEQHEKVLNDANEVLSGRHKASGDW